MDAPNATMPDEAPGERRGLSRRQLLGGGLGLAAAGGAAVVLGRREPDVPGELRAFFVDGPLPTDDPSHPAWGRARPATLALIPQQMATPWLREATLDEVDVRALFNGRDLGVLVEWDDEAPATREDIATFRDAAAVMLPVRLGGDPPAIMMGSDADPVYVAHWRASWQLDIDRGYQDVEDLYPGWYSDVHPEHETLVGLGLDAETGQVFAPGRAVGNPLSERERSSPVEELVAHGFGTLEHLDEQHASGRGVHEGGHWRVAIGVPSGHNAPDLSGTGRVPAAFAVWQGDRGQVGARKHFAMWIDIVLRRGG